LAAAVDGAAREPWWKLWLGEAGATLAGFTRWRQPLGAVALIAVGFFAARLIPAGAGSGVSTASLAPSEGVFVNVRSAQPDSTGRVRIAYDETRRREVFGTIDNPVIQKLVLAGRTKRTIPACGWNRSGCSRTAPARAKCATRS
jgi:hypothetical protein